MITGPSTGQPGSGKIVKPFIMASSLIALILLGYFVYVQVTVKTVDVTVEADQETSSPAISGGLEMLLPAPESGVYYGIITKVENDAVYVQEPVAWGESPRPVKVGPETLIYTNANLPVSENSRREAEAEAEAEKLENELALSEAGRAHILLSGQIADLQKKLQALALSPSEMEKIVKIQGLRMSMELALYCEEKETRIEDLPEGASVTVEATSNGQDNGEMVASKLTVNNCLPVMDAVEEVPVPAEPLPDAAAPDEPENGQTMP